LLRNLISFPLFNVFKHLLSVSFHFKLNLFKLIGVVNIVNQINFFQTIGIHHRLICPHTHEQNDTVERRHRHIVETGLTLLG
jgi:histone deacetylase 1/2